MEKTEVFEERVLLCGACNDKAEECWNCGKGFANDDEIYCGHAGYIKGHYCKKCKAMGIGE